MNAEEIQELVTRVKIPLVSKFLKLNSSHEGMAVIRLYSDKLWESVKNSYFQSNPSLVGELQRQAACVSAAALHFLDSVCGVTNSMELVFTELAQAESKFGAFNSQWEGFFVLQEEIDELWDVVKLNAKNISVDDTIDVNDEVAVLEYQNNKRQELLKEEAVQVAAMGIRFIKCLRVGNSFRNH